MRSSRKTDKIHEEEEEDSLVVPDTLLGELNDALCQSAGACQSPEEVPRRRRLLNNNDDDGDDMNSEEHNDAFEDDELSDMDMDDHTSHDDSGSSDEDDSEEDESVVELNPNYQIYLNRSETVEEDISSQDSSFNQDNQDNEDEDASLSPATSFDSHESNVSFKKNEKLLASQGVDLHIKPGGEAIELCNVENHRTGLLGKNEDGDEEDGHLLNISSAIYMLRLATTGGKGTPTRKMRSNNNKNDVSDPEEDLDPQTQATLAVLRAAKQDMQNLDKVSPARSLSNKLRNHKTSPSSKSNTKIKQSSPKGTSVSHELSSSLSAEEQPSDSPKAAKQKKKAKKKKVLKDSTQAKKNKAQKKRNTKKKSKKASQSTQDDAPEDANVQPSTQTVQTQQQQQQATSKKKWFFTRGRKPAQPDSPPKAPVNISVQEKKSSPGNAVEIVDSRLPKNDKRDMQRSRSFGMRLLSRMGSKATTNMNNSTPDTLAPNSPDDEDDDMMMMLATMQRKTGPSARLTAQQREIQQAVSPVAQNSVWEGMQNAVNTSTDGEDDDDDDQDDIPAVNLFGEEKKEDDGADDKNTRAKPQPSKESENQQALTAPDSSLESSTFGMLMHSFLTCSTGTESASPPSKAMVLNE